MPDFAHNADISYANLIKAKQYTSAALIYSMYSYGVFAWKVSPEDVDGCQEAAHAWDGEILNECGSN